MALSIAARRVDGVQGARCPKGSAEMAALSPESPYFRKQFAARRGVRKGQEDSLRRGDTFPLNLATVYAY